MFSLRFWEDWEPGIRRSFIFFGSIVIFLVLAFLISVWRSPAPTVTWTYYQEREVMDIPVHQFQTGPFALQVTGDNIVLEERLVGNEFLFQVWPAYIFLVAALIGLIILVSILSTFSRFWFFIGSGVLIFLLSGLRLELLNVLGQTNQGATIFLIILIVGAGVMFQYYFQSATIAKRLFIFSIIIPGSFSAVLLLAEVPNPGYLLAVGFIPSMVAGSVLLAIIVAHEIIATIIYVITRGLKGSNIFLHFSLLTLIYLANLVATYLNDQNYLRWDYSLNPIILLVVSAMLGVWGIRKQQEQKENFLLEGPAASLAIVGFLIIAAGASAFFYITGNDAAVETIRNLSLYAHISYGVIFFLYIVSNFGALLKENYPVGRVLYKPTNMPYFTFRLAGTITMAGFVLYNFYLRPIRDTTGARDAAMGDYYVVTGDLNMAEGFYKKSDSYAFHNHHANYVLGNIEGARRNKVLERQYYLNAAERRPTQQAYMNVINTLDNNPLNVYAYLGDLKKDFPYSGVANNTLGLVYADLNQVDSALLFFNLAKKDRLTSATAEMNLLATIIRNRIPTNVDSVNETIDTDKSGPLVNLFALANHQSVFLNQEIKLPADSLFNLFTASLVQNYLINRIDSVDTAFVSAVENLARIPDNDDYAEDVLAACALVYYRNGMINRAFKVMQEATVYSEYQGKRNNIMALWALDQNAPGVAIGYAQYSGNQNYDRALLTQSIALTESGRRGEAIVLFDSIRKNSKDLAPLAESLQRILAVKSSMVSNLNDLEKYSYCRYRLSYGDTIAFREMVETISNNNWKARAILDRSKKLLEWGEIEESIRLYNRLAGISISDDDLFQDAQLHELLLAAADGNIDVIKNKLEAGFRWSGSMATRSYIGAIMAEAIGDSLNMKTNLDWIVRNNSFFADGVIAAARLEKRNGNDPLGAYNILADALYLNPQSVKILKAYIREAHEKGFDDYVYDAKLTLQQVLPEPLFKRFLNTLQ